MTPKEKAKELVDRFLEVADSEFPHFVNLMHKVESKQCALIAVDEIINTYEELTPSHYITGYKTAEDFNENLININRQLEARRIQWLAYWQEVKQEIEKL